MTSKIDQAIILELQKNGRISYTELAAKLNISLSTAATRTERLLDAKMVEIKAVPNPIKMGLNANAVIFIQADPTKIDAICNQFLDNFNIPTILTIFGRHDILFFASFPNWDQMHDFINENLSRIAGVQKIETFFLKKFVKRYENIFGSIPDEQKPMKLSDTERKLVHELTRDGRLSLNEISGRIGIHVSNVSRKLRSLVNQEVIKIIAIPNAFKFGFNSSAFIVLEIEAQKVDAVCQKLHALSEIVMLARLINGSGVILTIQAVHNEALYRFIKTKISQLDGVLKIESFITAELKKRFYGWMLSETDMAAAAIL